MNNDTTFARYAPWFFAAAIYNFLWGSLNIIAPRLLFNLIGMQPPIQLALWQVVGMFVLVYAPAYWWASRFPYRHRHFILIGLLGKLLGPLGFLWAVISGTLPINFGWIILTNDLVWWPAFFLFLRDVRRAQGGWSALIRGE